MMIPVSTAKLILTIVGVLLFFVSVKTELPGFRWGGITLIVISFLLRFYRPRVPDSSVTTRGEDQ